MSKRTLLSVIFTLTILQVQSKTLNVLFIGNSYTYVNDVPSMVQHLGMIWNWAKPLIVLKVYCFVTNRQ